MGQRPRFGIALAGQQAVNKRIALSFIGQRVNLVFRQRRHRPLALVCPAEGVVNIGEGKSGGFGGGLQREQNAVFKQQNVVAEHVRAEGGKD